MTELVLGIVALTVGPGTIGFLWLRKRLNISPDAARAVAGEHPEKPRDYDQALILLASRIEELTEYKAVFPLWVGFGRRGWLHAPADLREVEPPMPKGVNL